MYLFEITDFIHYVNSNFSRVCKYF